jgi:hypothetical protein
MAPSDTTSTMSERDIAQARALRLAGLSWREIDDTLGRKRGYTLKYFHRRGWSAIGNDRRRVWRPASAMQAHQRDGVAGGGRNVAYVPPDSGHAPHFVLAERERAFNARQTLTALYFGDPLPGRSALDQRRP